MDEAGPEVRGLSTPSLPRRHGTCTRARLPATSRRARFPDQAESPMPTTRTDLRSPASRQLTGDSTTCEQSASDPDVPARGQNIREIAFELRLLLHRGISFALATVVGAQGVILRKVGTVMVACESGDTIGVNRGGCLDRAIQELAAQVLSTGADRLERYEIDQDAASYIGLSGRVSLDVHVMRATAGDPAFDDVLRYLDSPAATVAVIGTRGMSGCAAVGPDRVVGRLGWAELPWPVVADARRMLKSGGYTRRSYGRNGERGGDDVEVWMQSHPAAG
jgi:xanthine dehydrogenase accessory factor